MQEMAQCQGIQLCTIASRTLTPDSHRNRCILLESSSACSFPPGEFYFFIFYHSSMRFTQLVPEYHKITGELQLVTFCYLRLGM